MKEVGKEAVILEPAEMRGFHPSFLGNRAEPIQEVSEVNGKPVGLGEPRMTVACLAEYLEQEAAGSIFTAFKPAKRGERVYFIGTEDGPVKIGVTTNPAQRLEYLQTGSPKRLRLLAIVQGGRSLERAYHRYFDRHRLNGEWFDRSPDLEREIKHWSAKCRRLVA